LVIADDYRLYAESLSLMLNPLYETVAIATSKQELIESAARSNPDLIVTDILKPLVSGLEALRTLAAMGIRSKVIVLTLHVELDLAIAAFRSGASAFVLKTSTADEFCQAVDVVLAGASSAPRLAQHA
jgi:DNA-binding NarL/FixJ family response regulator